MDNYKNDPYYKARVGRYEQDKVLSNLVEFWGVFLADFYATQPLIHVVTCEPFSIGATEIIGKTFFDITLYHGDVLNFTNGLAVVRKDTKITGNVNTSIQVLQTYFQSGDEEKDRTFNTFAMIPFRSISDGGLGNLASTDKAEQLNRADGIWPTKAVTRKAFELQASGDLVKADPFVKILNAGQQLVFPKLFLETRYHPYVEFNYFDGTSQNKGSGPYAYRTKGQILDYNVRGTDTDSFQVVDFSCYLDAQINRYAVLDPILDPRFCPNDLRTLYALTYRRRLQTGPSVNFCPNVFTY